MNDACTAPVGKLSKVPLAKLSFAKSGGAGMMVPNRRTLSFF